LQRVLVIGGAGKQSAAVYLPTVLEGDRADIRLAAIADLVDPYTSSYSMAFSSAMQRQNTAWITLTDDTATNLSTLDEYLSRETIDTLIISCPPLYHYAYIQWGVQHGLDVICDKPVVARAAQFGDASAPALLQQDFESLCRILDQSKHRSDTSRSCRVYIPLMRRVTSPYTEIISGLHDVFKLTGQSLTYVLVSRSDGCYRFADEYDRPGAHGYRQGLGTLTMSAYHYLDFLAHCLTQAPPSSSRLEARLVNRTTVGDVRRATSSTAYRSLIGRTHGDPNSRGFIGDNAELDFHVTYSLKTNHESVPDCEVYFAFIQRGCTRRISPFYSIDTTHDEGLTNDSVWVIHQGPLQSFHLLLAHDPSTSGRATLVRRLNPKMAGLLSQPTLSISDVQLPRDTNTMKNRTIVRNLLEVCVGRQPAESYERLDMREQRTTLRLYTLALGAERGPCSSPWTNYSAH
jgi:hypothetical protein